jgi:very-short-patch-repair endonuclease
MRKAIGTALSVWVVPCRKGISFCGKNQKNGNQKNLGNVLFEWPIWHHMMDTRSTLRQKAKDLRKNMTEAEKRLWTQLRRRRVLGCKFRRQQPLGEYIVDFVCLSERLIVELDGGQHARDVAYDKCRDRWFIAQGFTVLRFWNNDVFDNINGVMYRISDALTCSLENDRRPPPAKLG